MFEDHRNYLALVQAVAVDGIDVDETQAAAAIEAAGRTWSDFRADVARARGEELPPPTPIAAAVVASDFRLLGAL